MTLNYLQMVKVSHLLQNVHVVPIFLSVTVTLSVYSTLPRATARP